MDYKIITDEDFKYKQFNSGRREPHQFRCYKCRDWFDMQFEGSDCSDFEHEIYCIDCDHERQHDLDEDYSCDYCYHRDLDESFLNSYCSR